MKEMLKNKFFSPFFAGSGAKWNKLGEWNRAIWEYRFSWCYLCTIIRIYDCLYLHL